MVGMVGETDKHTYKQVVVYMYTCTFDGVKDEWEEIERTPFHFLSNRLLHSYSLRMIWWYPNQVLIWPSYPNVRYTLNRGTKAKERGTPYSILPSFFLSSLHRPNPLIISTLCAWRTNLPYKAKDFNGSHAVLLTLRYQCWLISYYLTFLFMKTRIPSS